MATIYFEEREYDPGCWVWIIDDGTEGLHYKRAFFGGEEPAICTSIPLKWKIEAAKHK